MKKQGKVKLKFKRVILKISGEMLAGEKRFGIAPEMLDRVSNEVKQVSKLGVELGIVIGGGNIWRGAEERIKGLDRVTSDYMGMMGTIMNALALQSAFENAGVPSAVQSAIEVGELCEPFTEKSTVNHFRAGKVVIFAGGTGNPYFTTDTTAALRAVELKADVLFKATKVDGIYTSDPVENPGARKYSELKFMQAIEKKLRIMDITAFSLCMENKVKIVVFNLQKWGNVARVIKGEKIGTLVQ